MLKTLQPQIVGNPWVMTLECHHSWVPAKGRHVIAEDFCGMVGLTFYTLSLSDFK